MARFKNGFGEDRVVPSLGYVLVSAGAEINVPDSDAHHWVAGGWVRLDAPEPAAAPVVRPAPAAAVAPAAVESEEAK
jgi:hypothetical protein